MHLLEIQKLCRQNEQLCDVCDGFLLLLFLVIKKPEN